MDLPNRVLLPRQALSLSLSLCLALSLGMRVRFLFAVHSCLNYGNAREMSFTMLVRDLIISSKARDLAVGYRAGWSLGRFNGDVIRNA